ncbi:molybdopterin cofactor-binding domain-containing protein [Falsihalocynthiibacter sp. SS001]|uniref:xanthine dehydrogenase family protein molybdopterin-binding subunit n=1 Tax=Falsihalocynthiibacter sp. SS001 TaxID=3349698 RepID=UPI0036D42BE9
MSRLGKIARRTFLIGSAAIVGGVAFGYYQYKKPVENPLLDDLPDGAAALTPYVRIDADGVTIITPRADLGQGAYSIQAALVAEELDVAWQDIKVDPGPPSPAYFNSAVLGEGLPFAATDDGFVAVNARAVAGAVGKIMGVQITGGSSTVPDAYEKMRVAGAVARETLKAAAVQQTGVALADLKTQDGAVILPDGRELAYTELAPIAATIEPVKEVTLRPETEWKYLGKEMPRLDVVAKSTGTLPYGIDLEMEGMVYATVRTNPRRGGVLNSYDATAAEAARGVLKVVPVRGGAGVIADNTWRAFAAADLIEFDWGPASHPAEQDEIWAEVEASFIADREDSQLKDEGDVEAEFTKGDTLEASYRIPFLAHAPLEPMNATVLYEDGRLDVWTGTQIPLFMIANIDREYGLTAENIQIHNLYSGGSFGRRLEDQYVHQAVELAMAHQGVPIKMTWSREEDMTHDFPRPLAMSKARGRVENGAVTGFDLGIAAPSVTSSQMSRLGMPVMGPDLMIVAGAWDQPFDIPNYRVTGYRVPEMVPISSWRSVGASGNAFLHEGFLDELIHAAGADPLEERLRLCSHDVSRKVLEAVGEMSDWGSPMAEGRGRGLAFTLSFGVPVAEVVEVTNTDDGIQIDKVFVAADVGRILDPINFENQVQGGVIWGLSHAVMSELTYSDGQPEQNNFDGFESMRMFQAPEVFVRGLENASKIRGIGEPAVPPAAPALANAIFAATGQRIREMPLQRHIDFVY